MVTYLEISISRNGAILDTQNIFLALLLSRDFVEPNLFPSVCLQSWLPLLHSMQRRKVELFNFAPTR